MLIQQKYNFVSRFSNAKKCSNGGRALMQLDFTQLKSKFEKVTLLRPMPHREYVELYIKAYYLPENSFEEWIKEHKVPTYSQYYKYIGTFLFFTYNISIYRVIIISCLAGIFS